jgi:hypothetical protein
MHKKQLGGKREGAGRPKGEPKKAIGLRVPVKYHKQLTKLVKDELKKLMQSN